MKRRKVKIKISNTQRTFKLEAEDSNDENVTSSEDDSIYDMP